MDAQIKEIKDLCLANGAIKEVAILKEQVKCVLVHVFICLYVCECGVSYVCVHGRVVCVNDNGRVCLWLRVCFCVCDVCRCMNCAELQVAEGHGRAEQRDKRGVFFKWSPQGAARQLAQGH